MESKNDIDPSRTEAGRTTIKQLGSPKDIHRQNLLTVLEWIYRWGFSTSEIISNLLMRKNRTHARRLEESGWLRSVSIKGYPTCFMLTERGLAEVINHAEQLWEYKEIDPYRVSMNKFHHDCVAQSETVSALTNLWIRDYWTERMLWSDGKFPFKKIPDVIWVKNFDPDEVERIVERSLQYSFQIPLTFDEVISQIEWADLIAVEIELSAKFAHKLDGFVGNCVDDLVNERFGYVIVISASKAIHKNYEEAFSPGRSVTVWEQGKNHQPVDGKLRIKIPDSIHERVFFKRIGWMEEK